MKTIAVRVLLGGLGIAVLSVLPGVAAKLTYIEDAPAQKVLLTDPLSGVAYFARLAPDRETDGRVVVLDLELCQIHGRRDCNLLEPEGNWHGAEPFSFFASEFGHSGKEPIFGRIRTLPMRHTHAMLNVAVENAAVKPNYAFSSLILELAVVGGNSSKRTWTDKPF